MHDLTSTEALREKKVNFELVLLKKAVHSVEDVQKECKCKKSEVIKTLVLIEKEPIVVILPGDLRASIKKVGTLIGEKKLRMATPKEVKFFTGYDVGTVSPFGIDSTILQIADESMTNLSNLFLGSGKNDVLIKMKHSEFKKVFQGKFALISI